MPQYEVAFDTTVFLDADADPDADLTEAEAAALTEKFEQEDKVPENIHRIVGATMSADDGQGGDEIKAFISVRMIVEADDYDDAWHAEAPEEMLKEVVETMCPEVDLSGSWEIIDVTDVPQAEVVP